MGTSLEQQKGRRTASTKRPRRMTEKNRPLYDILKRIDAVSAWLAVRKNFPPEVFLFLAENLSAADRESLDGFAPVALDGDHDLLILLAEQEREIRQLRSHLLTDELTGLYNKRFFLIQLETEVARTRRTGQSCSLMILDFDNFKLLNDTLGHDEGDQFLLRMGDVLRENLRPTDFACRFGGDEYAVILPVSGLIDAVPVARRIQQALAAEIGRLATPLDNKISCSIGLVDYQPWSDMAVADFFRHADQQLYRAKREGKNRIVFPTSEEILPRRGTEVSSEEKAALFGDLEEEIP